MNLPVFDLHCDTASLLAENRELSLLENPLHIDLKRASALPGYAQCFACFTTTEDCTNPLLEFERQLYGLMAHLEKNKDVIAQAFSPEDVDKNYKKGIMSAIFTLEGPAGIGFDPELLQELYSVGFRISTLGWNESNPLTGSNVTGGGLTDLGAVYVKEAQRLGMLVDVSHISDEGFWDIVDITNAPIVATHSNSRRVWDVKRNLTDEMFLEICKTGGVAGINLYSEFLGAEPDLDTVCDHIFHFLELDPTGTHIALGGDLDGCETLPKGFRGIENYGALAEQLKARGLDENTLMNIFWNNAMGVMKLCCM